MQLREAYRRGVAQGGDGLKQALGRAEAVLKRDPGNALALIYKGSLLTMIGARMPGLARRREYLRTGIALMDSAATLAGNGADTDWELAYVRTTTLAVLPVGAGADLQQDALAALRTLTLTSDFTDRPAPERVRVLTLLACQAELSGRTDEARTAFVRARAIDADLAVRTYTEWSERPHLRDGAEEAGG